MRAKTIPINASSIIQQYGKTELGQCEVTQIHLSSREDFEFDNQRMKRWLWKDIKDNRATYACEQKIRLSYDDII